ncbi:pirin family protein [Nocardioides sp. C4-1]|uniref:pirin family protein n=1 Tax=Nocardioides sp. C4-1 TaxID=3151851 RepID=UPI003263A3B9
MSAEIRRGTDRFVDKQPGRVTRHSFAFGDSYDADNLRFGPMVCHDDHFLADGRGFETHRHSGLVIVTYVATGALAHTGPAGETTVPAGSIAVLRTGAGVEHSEVAAAPQTRFVQVWLSDEQPTAEPTYDVLPEGVSTVEPLPGARFDVVRLADGETCTVPPAARAHVYVVRGALLRSSLAEPMQEGDAFRFVDEPARDLAAAVASTLLVWTFAG